METLKVQLKTREELIENDILFCKEGSSIYQTDVIGYKDSLSGAKVTLKEAIGYFGDGTGWLTTEGTYIHIDWIQDAKISQQYLVYKGDYYTLKLKKTEVTRCVECGSIEPLILTSKLCRGCFNNQYANKKGYSHKPTPTFYGSQIAADKKNPVWYGIELEHSCTSKDSMAEFIFNYDKEDSLYLKADSSIYSCDFPCEMVSHPHSFSELMKSEWVNNLDKLNVKNPELTKNHNGCHIHISNTAFENHKHYAKWYFFVYSLASGVLQRIANRECTAYCQNVREGTIVTKELGAAGSSRKVIINERNEHTREVRIFSTTTNPKELKIYIQFLEATIKYSKYAKKKLSFPDFVKYIGEYISKYQELFDFVNGMEGTKIPKALIIPNKIVTVDDITKIPTENLNLITRVQVGRYNYENITGITIDFISEKIRVNGDTHDFNDILEVDYATN